MTKDKNDKPENDTSKAGAGPDAPPAPDSAPPPDAPPAPKKPVLVRMVRMVRPGPKPPTTADVHPAEVANYAAGGWRIEKEK